MDVADPRVAPAVMLLVTLAFNTFWTWPHLPYWPIEFSQMGWGAPGRAGGYHNMAIGLNITAALMFRIHVEERSLLGAVGAVLMTLLAFINGNDVPVLQVAHGIVAFSCFAIYIVYIKVNGGPMAWVYAAGIALVLGHLIVLTQLDVSELLRHGVSAWPRVWTEAQAKHSVWILRVKAFFQCAMIAALFVGYFSTPVKAKSA